MEKHIVRACAAFLLVCFGRVQGESPVNIPDPVLKAAIEKAIWVSDPTPTDMLALTELTCIQDWGEQEKGISDLTGLEYATNLRTLNLRLNQIGSIGALSGLILLSSLDLSQNFVGDLSPLSGLHELTCLNIHENYVSDLSPLSGLPNLGTLVLRGNVVSDVSPLSSVASLRDLDLGANQISDISPLSSLNNLLSLILFNNQISDISYLSALPCLALLDLDTNFVTNISSLCGMTCLSHLDIQNNPLPEKAYVVDIPCIIANNPSVVVEHDGHAGRYLTVSSTVGGKVTDPGEGQFNCENNQSVRLTAKADPGFTFAGWTGKRETTDNPVSIVVNSDCVMRACFLSLRDTLYVNDNALGEPNSLGTTGSSSDVDGSPEHPMQAIQDAIDVAGQETTIIVRPGIYRENINLPGKKIHVAGIDPLDPHSGPCAVIEGTGDGPVVSIGGGAGAKCSLSGFVITKGRGNMAGGIYCSGSHPTLSHCLIVGNRCTDPNGAAMYFDDSKAVLVHCTIVDNDAGTEGAAFVLVDSDITMTDSIVWGNRPNEIRCRGTSDPSILYCCVQGWWPDIGNTHANPLFARPGNWANQDDTSDILSLSHSATVWMDGDYHLKSEAGRWDPTTGSWLCDDATSPCVDAGDPEGGTGHESAPNGGRVNMGVYGGTTEASRSR